MALATSRGVNICDTHRMPSEACCEAFMSESICREWYRGFRNGEFHVEGRCSGGSPKVFEDELERFFDEDSCQTHEELARSLIVSKQPVSKPGNDTDARIWGVIRVETVRC